MEVQKTLGLDIACTDNVARNDQVQLLRQYAMKGYDIMSGHGFQFGDSLIQAGDEFPDKYFFNYGGTACNGRNVAAINYAYGQTGALPGVVEKVKDDIINNKGDLLLFF